jgi:hypothetical protein
VHSRTPARDEHDRDGGHCKQFRKRAIADNGEADLLQALKSSDKLGFDGHDRHPARDECSREEILLCQKQARLAQAGPNHRY